MTYSDPDAFLKCRDWGHSWTGYVVERLAGTRFKETLVCERCGAMRARVISKTGGILSRSGYRYRDGYLQDPKEPKRTRAELRTELLERLADRDR